MVLAMTRPWKHPRTSVYYLRQRVPADLVATVGKKEVKVSLRTKDPTEAKLRHVTALQKIQDQWRLARAKSEPLTQKQIFALAGEAYREWVEQHDEQPGEPSVWQALLERNRHELRRDPIKWFGSSIDALLARHKLKTDEESRKQLILAAAEAIQQASEVSLRKSQGDYSPDPMANRFPPLQPQKQETKVKLLDLFQLWERDHLKDGKPQRTIEDFRQKIEDFIKFLGHDDATRVTPRNVADYVEHLRHERNLAARTVGPKYLAVIRTIYRTGISKIVVKEDPTEHVKVRQSKPVRERSKGFTDDEAAAILQCALRDPSTLGGMSELNKLACRWVPWMCAYTGARAGEITQLRKEDFITEYGIECVRISPEAGTVKTRKYRLVPLHPHLIEMGLLEFVRTRPPGPLFYRSSGRKTRPGYNPWDSVTGKVSDWVRKVAKVRDPRVQPNHGWRHRFKTIARDVDIPQRYMDALQGHEDGSASADYGDNTVNALYREIQKLPRCVEK
ncbi:MAG: phage integrase N-terminal SAM-like domain-containing protein [Alphaproteobacteria bacterium]|jgi:integrase|nr:phage integrase N-terminal SAM-like domain-containing protein [Alphaproteobacteria bacterium]MBU1552310.1 phage integrase N-terminal SAM-like domain-containing protein [Alphaproteobacteria bacterium]MBU2334503.1 phage integrase N-terminal SAM-like domain-containing protein [Alphaproteobacteria bacterium]MBU2386359.1 phage integrase N-terminal SAM-like domain-containing protein [Alphaproteobacteria bacterium]